MKSDDPSSRDDATGEVPMVSPADPRVTVTGAELASDLVSDDTSLISELPHWTEMPTGQVPIVVARDVEPREDAWDQIPAPAWREGEADWVAHEDQFDASVLAGELTPEEPFALIAEVETKSDEVILEETPRPEPAREQRTRVSVANPLAGRAARRANDSSVLRATVTGILMAVVVFAIFHFGSMPTAAVILFVLAVAAGEALAQFRAVQAHPATMLAMLGTITVAFATYNKGTSAIGAVTVLMVLFGFAWYALSPKKVDILDGLGSTLLTFAWVGVLGSYAMALISPVSFPDGHGMSYLVAAVVLTICNDTGALFIGRWIGRHPLVAMSPNKTREGFIGGTLITVILGGAVLVPMMSTWSVIHGVIAALAISVVVPMGDLFESLIKRTLGIKDMGRVLPGMGGLLDRVDGLLFALPTMYYVVHVLRMG